MLNDVASELKNDCLTVKRKHNYFKFGEKDVECFARSKTISCLIFICADVSQSFCSLPQPISTTLLLLSQSHTLKHNNHTHPPTLTPIHTHSLSLSSLAACSLFLWLTCSAEANQERRSRCKWDDFIMNVLENWSETETKREQCVCVRVEWNR